MVYHQKTRNHKPTFNASLIDTVTVKANSQSSGRRKIVAKFFLACSRARHSARRLAFLFAIKTRGRRITPRSQKNSGRRTLTSPTKRNTEFGIGRAGDALPRARRSGA